MKYTLTIKVEGETEDDLVLALKELTPKVEDGYVSGMDSNDTGSYHFEVEED
jgi:6-pyruvoyl-tetrahydropterin synthase